MRKARLTNSPEKIDTMKPVKALVIDDMPSAVTDLCNLLKENPIVDVCGTANSCCDGIKLIREKKPELLFLDIQMPGKSGFDLVRWLKDNLEQIPYIIFVTGFNSFILQALREGALDYLVKPVNEADLTAAIERARLAVEQDARKKKLDDLLNYIDKRTQVFLPSVVGYCSVDPGQIVYIWRNTQMDRVELVLGEDQKHIMPVNYSLSKLLGLLPQVDFFAVKKGTVINLRYVKEIETYKRDWDCVLQKGDFIVKVQVSRRNQKDFRDRMGL